MLLVLNSVHVMPLTGPVDYMLMLIFFQHLIHIFNGILFSMTFYHQHQSG